MSFKDKLKEELKNLPGAEVQWSLASSDRMRKNFPLTPREDSVSAAVLILLYPFNSSIHTLFIQRPDYDGVHGGQISFPGGKQEKSDSDLYQTALREAGEETGIKSGDIEIAGMLTPLYIPVSNILVTPVVAWSNSRPDFRIQESEVRFIIEARLAGFIDYSNIRSRPFEIRGEMIEVKYFDYEGHVIWGATAMIFNELLAIINRSGLDRLV